MIKRQYVYLCVLRNFIWFIEVFFQLFIMHSGSCNIVGGEQFSSAAFVVTFSVLDIGIVGNSMIVFKHYQIARSP